MKPASRINQTFCVYDFLYDHFTAGGEALERFFWVDRGIADVDGKGFTIFPA